MTKEEWLAIKNNDKSYDGKFFYALKTTGTVCRPSCTARSCNPKNVIIFYDLEDAYRCGFRPCQRCYPDRLDWEGVKSDLVAQAKQLIEENYMEKFSLKAISSNLFVNESYLLRTFKEITGMTMLEYHNFVRCEKAKKLLERMELSISFIASSVGYCTASHFTRVFKQEYGCTPSQYRQAFLKELSAVPHT